MDMDKRRSLADRMEGEGRPQEKWEAIQTVTGDTYIFRDGYKEEADVKDVFKFGEKRDGAGQLFYQFSRFDLYSARPATGSPLRLNRAVIAFAWYVDPLSDLILKLKDAVPLMDAKRDGVTLPGERGA